MFQTKEQDKNQQEQLNAEEISNLTGKHFRVMIVKMIQDLGKRTRHRLRSYKRCLTKS